MLEYSLDAGQKSTAFPGRAIVFLPNRRIALIATRKPDRATARYRTAPVCKLAHAVRL
jgi:hypothetical protein